MPYGRQQSRITAGITLPARNSVKNYKNGKKWDPQMVSRGRSWLSGLATGSQCLDSQGGRELAATSCPLISTWVPWHMHTQNKRWIFTKSQGKQNLRWFGCRESIGKGSTVIATLKNTQEMSKGMRRIWKVRYAINKPRLKLRSILRSY